MIVRFQNCVLDTGLRQLRRDNRVVRLQPKAFDLLVHLVEHRDRVLSKDELFDALWPDEVVSESALSFSIKAVRKALGDDGRPRRFVETAHARGFRFIAECVVEEPAPGGGRAATAATPRRPRRGVGAPRRRWNTPFVGREAELAIMRASLAAALGGSARVCWLSGEPGIGKTRLASVALQEAADQGVRVLAGRCHDQSAPSLWPWVQIVRSYLDAAGDEATEVLGHGAGDIARLVPAVHDCVPGLVAVPATDAEQARLRLFDSIVEFLGNDTRREPLALWLEDLHWSDASSLLLLRLALEELASAPLFVVASYRSAEVGQAHPLSATLASLRRESRSEELALRGLTTDQASDLVRALGSAVVEDAWLQSVVERAEGNPFFLEELCRDRSEQDANAAESRILPLGVRDTIERRLSRIGPACREMLGLAAVIGRDFEFDVLRAAGGSPVDDLVGSVEQAIAADLITEVDGGVLRFAHALVQEGLRDGLTHLRRAEMHRRVGEALAARDQPGDLSRLAHHFLNAVPLDGWARAFAYLRRAADDALARLAFEEAADLYQKALGVRPAADPLPADEQVTLLIALATAHRHAGQLETSRERFEQALTTAREAGLTTRFAEVAMAMRWTWALRDDATTAALEEALTHVDETEGALRARLLSGVACGLYTQVPQTARRCRALIDQAIDDARRLDDRETLVQVLDDCQLALWSPDNAGERLALADEQRALARDLGSSEIELRAWTWRVAILAEVGRFAEAASEVPAYVSVAEQSGWPRFVWSAFNCRAAVAYLNGQLDAAEDLATRGYAIGQRLHGTTIAMLVSACHLWTIRIEQGRLDEIAPTLIAVGESMPGVIDPAWMDLVRIDLHVFRGELEAARELYRPLAAAGFTGLPAPNAINTLRAVTYVAGVAVALDDAAGAARLYEMLRPYSGQWIVFGLGTIILGATDLPLGMLAATMGAPERGVEHLERSIRDHDRCGAPLPAMRSRLELARILLRHRGVRDRRRARTLLAEAREAAQAVEHQALLRDVDAVLAGARAR